MDNLKELKKEELIELVRTKKVGLADLTDSSICPTCFDRENDNVLYGDCSDKVLYEDELFECFLIDNPRAIGHTVINTKKHYKDMMEIDDITCEKIFKLAKIVMINLREVYNSESVYLCTMCDGPMNHFHIQLIPRYSYEKRGSNNFVKPRLEYVEDLDKIEELRRRLKNV